MKKSDREKFKKILIAYKHDLLKKVEQNSKANQEISLDEVRDTADMASDFYERELSIGLSETERFRLEQVEDALERIEKGNYGKCEECGELIAAPRLEALPFAKFCIQCQAIKEKR